MSHPDDDDLSLNSFLNFEVHSPQAFPQFNSSVNNFQSYYAAQNSFHQLNQQLTHVKKKKERLSNYAFKAPLRLFLKIALNFEGPESLHQQLRSIAKEKNLKTFPKLVCYCQQQGIRRQISQIWSFRAQQYLSQKKNTLQPRKFQEIVMWVQRMTQSLDIGSWEQFITCYWGEKVRHKDKLQKCINEIEEINSYEY